MLPLDVYNVTPPLLLFCALASIVQPVFDTQKNKTGGR